MSDERLERIENKIDKLADRISSIDSTLAAQHEQLKVHIKRTDILEQQVVPLVKSQVITKSDIAKLIGIIAAIAAIVEGAVSLLTHLKH